MGCSWLARGVRGGGEGRTPDARWRVKRVRGPAGRRAAGGGGRARPRHAPAKGANWREEQGAGPGARLGARLEGPTRDGAAARRAPSTSGAGRGAVGWAPFPPPSPPATPLQRRRSLGPRAEAASAAGKRARRLLTRARVDRLGVAALVRGILEPADLWLPTRASWDQRPLLVGDGGSGLMGFCYTWIRLAGWVGEVLYIRVVILEQVRAAVTCKTIALSV